MNLEYRDPPPYRISVGLQNIKCKIRTKKRIEPPRPPRAPREEGKRKIYFI
jgi:hypothetical protein